MNCIPRRSLLGRSLLALGLAASFAGTATAQTYPTRPISMVVGFAPGGPADVVARLIAPGIGADLGQTMGWKATGGVCDGNNIAACGVPVVDTMGVRGGAIHSEEEYLIVDSLAERAALSTLAILRLAEGNA